MLRLVAVLGAAACLLLVLGVAAPSSAQAQWLRTESITDCNGMTECFAWYGADGLEDFSVEPVSLVVWETYGWGTMESVFEGSTLSPEAEEVLQDSSFIASEPVEAAAAVDATEGGSAILAGEASGLLPDLALASPYVAGATVAVIGVATACDALFDGCFGIFGSAPDPVGPVGVARHEIGENPGGSLWGSWFPRGTVYFTTTSVSGDFREGLAEACGSHGYSYTPPVRPPGRLVRGAAEGGGSVTCADGTAQAVTVREAVVVADGSTRRIRNEGAVSSPSVPHPLYCQQGSSGCVTTPPSNWPQKYSECLLHSASSCGLTADQAGRLGRALGHAVDPGVVADPYQVESVVPGCGGLTYEQCRAKLEAEGLEPVKNTLGWQQADLGVAPDRVVSLQPSAGTAVKTGAKVTVAVNPALAAMPLVLPQWEDHETYAHYVARLPTGFVPHKQEVGETNEDAEAGPEAVLGTNPAPGARADPNAETGVDVRTNPATAPSPGSGTGTCSASVGAIDWTPLNKPLGDVFPFGVFAFFTGWLSSWESGSAQPPDWTVAIVPAGVFGSADGLYIHINLAFMAPVVSVARVVFLFAAFVGLLWFLATAAAKLQGDSS